MNESFINSTTTTTTTTEIPYRYYLQKVQYYFLPALIIFGVLGNTLSAYVILKTKLKKLSSSFYLLALATNDSIILLTIGNQWLHENDIDLYNHPIACESFAYFGDLCGSLSVWLIVAFTAERFMAVKYPLRSRFLCTVRRAKIIIAILVAVIAIIYSPLLLIAGLETNQQNKTVCTRSKKWLEYGAMFSTFDMIFSCVIPVCIIGTLNSIICRKVWRFSNIRRRMTDNFEMETLSEPPAAVVNEVRIRANRSSYKMTKMLLIVSTVCLCMILPSYIIRLVLHFHQGEFDVRKPENAALVTLQLYSQFLYYLTFAINFGLYCVSGQNFRKAVAVSLCCCLCCKTGMRRDGTATTTENRTQSSGLLSYQASSCGPRARRWTSRTTSNK